MTAQPEIAPNELQHDALTELINIGVSRAAKSLAQIISHEVVLSVPSVVLRAGKPHIRSVRAAM
jgi:chemotaxis protein CheC